MSKVYDLAVVVGAYDKGGETKKRYESVGVVMQGEKGMYILLNKTFNPAGVASEGSKIVISMFEPKDKDGAKDFSPMPTKSSGEIPF